MAISGIFSRKDADLELLPPPPPFPAMMDEQIPEKREPEKEAIQIEEKVKKKDRKIKVGIKQRRVELSELYESLGVSEEEKKHKNEKLPKARKVEEIPITENFDEELKEIEDIELGHEDETKAVAPEIESAYYKGYKDSEEEKPYENVASEKEISDAIDSIKRTQKRTSFLKALFGKKEKVSEEKVEIPDVMPRFDEKVDGLVLIEEKIHKARLALMDFRFDQARIAYMEIMGIYNQLEPRKKAKVYQDIADLYYERKSAEKYAK